MKPNEAQKMLTQFFLGLGASKHGLGGSVHKIVTLGKNRVRVTWATAAVNFTLTGSDSGSISQYRGFIQAQQASAILSDGCLLQASLDFNKDQLVAHRFAFVPCPFEFSAAELANEAIDDIIASTTDEELLRRIVLRPYLRFDYAIVPDDHPDPLSHLHFGDDLGRVPVTSPLSFRSFVSFVLEHFYPDALELDCVKRLPDHAAYSTIRSMEKQKMHLMAPRGAVLP